MYGFLRLFRLAWIVLSESVTHPAETSLVSIDGAGHVHIERISVPSEDGQDGGGDGGAPAEGS